MTRTITSPLGDGSKGHVKIGGAGFAKDGRQPILPKKAHGRAAVLTKHDEMTLVARVIRMAKDKKNTVLIWTPEKITNHESQDA